jgi:aminoglycoside phosphotransferase (APT) family kinase protein
VVNEAYVFGFPRREAVIDGIRRELELLPRLAGLLPLRIPVPVFVGGETDEFPWPFYGSELLAGVEPGDAQLDDDARTEIGIELAGFLRRLHGLDLAAELPLDPNRRADMQFRVPMTREAIAELDRLGVWRSPPGVAALLEEAERLPLPESSAVAHGDLHFRHVLVDRAHASGVLDWIDLCRADPAIDLQLYWSFLPPEGRPAFAEAYGPIGEAQLLRARVLALFLSAVLARYGHAEGHDRIAREALAGLERTLSS